ncbi:virion morphogenesis protein [Helicobacter valdiviensis]|uniref:Virion morphogenesis protein n=1 Tax=Helicobacter valdiviensis TaxID=1458358 RepID=A0A2W6MTB6_9HELI|nr:phage virion morphogenesis protein [Helicobacter valdiviensis]PZT47191.1 virion morphogenesis protein [Helicobacter valdiviensis]
MTEITIKGLDRFFRACGNFIDLQKHSEPLLRGAGETIRKSILESFAKETSPFGEKWKALKPSTIAQKKKEGKNKGILKRDGELSENWHVDFKKGEAIVTNNSQTKSGFKYGVVHQWGNKKRKIPQRAFLPIKANGEIQKDIKEVIKNDTKDYIKSILKKGG